MSDEFNTPEGKELLYENVVETAADLLKCKLLWDSTDELVTSRRDRLQAAIGHLYDFENCVNYRDPEEAIQTLHVEPWLAEEIRKAVQK